MASDANWIEIDPTSLDHDARTAYEAYKAAYRTAKDYRKAFETAMATKAELPPTQRMVFGYNFGKLSVAIVANDRPVRAPAKRPQSLSDYLAAQAQR